MKLLVFSVAVVCLWALHAHAIRPSLLDIKERATSLRRLQGCPSSNPTAEAQWRVVYVQSTDYQLMYKERYDTSKAETKWPGQQAKVQKSAADFAGSLKDFIKANTTFCLEDFDPLVGVKYVPTSTAMFNYGTVQEYKADSVFTFVFGQNTKFVNPFRNPPETMNFPTKKAKFVDSIDNWFTHDKPVVLVPGANLTWVTDEDRAGLGFAGEPLMITRTSGPSDGGVGMSRADLFLPATLKAYARSAGPPESRKKLFAIIDSDNFHHGSASLVSLAFNASVGVKRIIVHFDFHPDYTGPSSVPLIGCHTWMNFVIGKSADTIMWVGGGKLQGTSEFVWPNTMSSTDSGSYTPMDTKLTIEEQLNELIGDSKAHVYLTVDRDFMAEACTPWGKPPFTRAQGHAGIHSILSACHSNTNCTIVGADINGFPTPEFNNNNKATCMEGAMIDTAFMLTELFATVTA